MMAICSVRAKGVGRNWSPCGARDAFTLIELLVVAGIICLLAAIVFPAVQAARESARRTQCANNLKQVGIAINAYHEQHGILPSMKGQRTCSPISPLARFLPYLELKDIYDQINFDRNCYFYVLPEFGAVQETALLRKVSTFLCPSDPMDSIAPWGPSNLRCSMGMTIVIFDTGPHDGRFVGGAFGSEAFYRFSEFPKGLSQTVGVSERIKGDWTEGIFSTGDYYIGKFEGFQNANAVETLTWCDHLPESTAHDSRSGQSWLVTGHHNTGFNCLRPPNSDLRDCSVLGDGSGSNVVHGYGQSGVFSARSFHPDGVNALMLDGRVEFVSSAINLDRWRDLNTRLPANARPAGF